MIGPNFNIITLSKIKIKPIIRRPEHLIHFLSLCQVPDLPHLISY